MTTESENISGTAQTNSASPSISSNTFTGTSPAQRPEAIVTADRITNVEGSVKWFDPKKGFGFIVGPAGQDIFAHFSRIAGDGFRVLKDGSRVLYDAERSDKGWSATRVVRVDEGDPAVRRHYPRTPRR